MIRQHLLEEQLKEYEARIPMTKYERRALRKWVRDGHSVYETPGSKYLPDREDFASFLDIYRQDREIEEAISGMSPTEKERWLKDYLGFEEPDASTQSREASESVNVHTDEEVLFFAADTRDSMR